MTASQMGLFGETDLPDPSAPQVQVRHDAMDTSQAAAAIAFPKSGSEREKVLAAIAVAPDGCTDDEMLEAWVTHPNGIRARRGELVTAGWVVDSGRRRKTRTGQAAAVWTLSDAGRRQWKEKS